MGIIKVMTEILGVVGSDKQKTDDIQRNRVMKVFADLIIKKTNLAVRSALFNDLFELLRD